MRVCLFEDATVADLEPLTRTRPAFDLLCGLGPMWKKQTAAFQAKEIGALVRPLLADVCRLQHPTVQVNEPAWVRSGPVVFVNSRWLPPPHMVMPTGPVVGLVDGCVAYAVLAPAQLASCDLPGLPDFLQQAALPCHDVGGTLVRYPWDLVQANARQIVEESQHLAPTSLPQRAPAIVGPPERVFAAPSARFDPMVVLDTTGGPIVIGEDVVVTAFTRIEGPCAIGPHCQLFGAKIRGGCTFGPQCRIGGEVEVSIVQGYSNKYHDGFLGHSYLGEWVNLGAGTTASDLRNDYGPVNVVLSGRRVATGLTKVGCFLGDHTKTGLGVLLNTGTNVGVFCNLLPTGKLLPKYVPSFSRVWNGQLSDQPDVADLLATAETVMQRRGQELTDAHRRLYEQLAWEQIRPRLARVA